MASKYGTNSVGEAPLFIKISTVPNFLIISFGVCSGILFTVSLVVLIIAIVKKNKKLIIIVGIGSMILFCCSVSSLLIYLADDSDTVKTSLSNDQTPDLNIDSDLEPVILDDSNTYQSNQIINMDELYFFDVGDLGEIIVERSGYTNSYSYCYPQEGVMAYDGSICMDDEVEIFTISIIDEETYNDYIDLEYQFIILENSERIIYILEVPNGMLPQELLPITQYTDLIQKSFKLK